MDKQNSKNSYKCPECDNKINLTKAVSKGLIIECPACGTESEFISVSPVRLAPLEEEK